MQEGNLQPGYDYPVKRCLQEEKTKLIDDKKQKEHHKSEAQDPQEDSLVRDSVPFQDTIFSVTHSYGMETNSLFHSHYFYLCSDIF